MRFELTAAALAPELQIIAPWRDWTFKSRTDLLMPIALATGAATLVQAVTSFVLSQTLGVAAQRERVPPRASW